MQHFFVTPGQVKGERIYINGTDVNHISHVLRMKPGEELIVSDGNNHKYRCTLCHVTKEEAVVQIEEEEQIDRELPSRIYLFQGLPKSDKMEWIIQKAVELGVYEVIPVAAKRSVVRLDEKKAEKKIARWQEIARSAAKQAGREIIPAVTKVMDYREALSYAGNLDVRLIPYELAQGMDRTKEVIHSICRGQSIGIFIGPEGGFEKEEVALACHVGAKEITLGKRILRTETAGITILSILMYHLEA